MNHARFSTLDGLRGVAAVAVFEYHCHELFGFIFLQSYLAVDLFFGLSGFVLSYAYEERIRSGMSVRIFMAFRILRLYPLYILATAIGAAYVLADASFGRRELTAVQFLGSLGCAILFLPVPERFNASGLDLFPFLYPAWSLFFELLVNLFYATLIPALSNRVLCLLIGVGAILVGYTGYEFGSLSTGFNWNNAWGGAARVLFSFFTGVLLFRMRIRYAASFVPRLVVGLLFVSFALPIPASLQPGYDLCMVMLLFPAMILVGAASEPEPLTKTLFVFFGAISYAVYAMHAPIIWWVEAVGPRLMHQSLGGTAPLTGLLLGICVVILCYVLDRFYDAPIRRFISVRYLTLAKPSAATAPVL